MAQKQMMMFPLNSWNSIHPVIRTAKLIISVIKNYDIVFLYIYIELIMMKFVISVTFKKLSDY